MTLKFYPEPFDINKPPPAPPNREFTIWPFIGKVYTKKSNQREAEYIYRAAEYSRKLRGEKFICGCGGEITIYCERKKDAKFYLGAVDTEPGEWVFFCQRCKTAILLPVSKYKTLEAAIDIFKIITNRVQ